MFMIICFHCSFHGKFLRGGYNEYIINIFNMFGELGVNCFVLISGYFYDRSHFKIKKFFDLIIQTWFYVIIGIVIAKLVFNQDIISLIKDWLFPIIRDKYWFVTCFILLYLFQPFFCKLINVLTNKQLRQMVILMLTIWSIIPSFMGKIEDYLYFNRFIWVTVIFFVGALINKNSGRICLRNSITLFIITLVALMAFIFVFTKLGISRIPGNYWWPANSMVQVVMSVSLFCIFVKMRMQNKKIINYVASCTFGIYLLHDGVLRNILWDDIFNTYLFGTNCRVMAGIIISAIIVFLAGIIVDTLYKILNKGLNLFFVVVCNKKRNI